VPEGCTNLGFIGQFVEVDEDAVFTVETSVRTALEAVYSLTKLDKEKLEIFPTRYDIRSIIEGVKYYAGIKEAFTTSDIPTINPFKLHELKTRVLNFLNSIPPYYVGYCGRDKSVAEKESVLDPKFPKDTD